MRAARLAAGVALALASCGQAGGTQVACGPVERPQLQGGQHLIGDREPPVPYSSTPPTSGWHALGAPPFGVAGPEDPLTEPEQVSVLEAGGVVVTYHDLPAADIRLLETIASGHPELVAVTPYGALEPGQVALTAWGTVQRCDRVDVDAITAFIDAHSGTGGHGGHGHAHGRPAATGRAPASPGRPACGSDLA